MPSSPSTDRPLRGHSRGILHARFIDREILGEQGRLLFSLLHAFSSAGYAVSLSDTFPENELGKYGRLARSLEGVKLNDALPPRTEESIYLFDREEPALSRRRWRRKCQVKFDVFSRYWFSRPLIFPFPLHPVHSLPDLPARLAQHRSSPRKMRIFFSGETEGYVASAIRHPKPKLPRQQVIGVINGKLGGELVFIDRPAALDAILDSRLYTGRFVMTRPGVRIDERQWLRTLAQSDFFLCPPGRVMPMCHNAIEAMAVGTIPITSYPEWFDPALAHLANCVVFDDEQDLIAQLRRVLQMGDLEIGSLRQRVLEYYESQLTAAAFISRLERHGDDKVVILMLTERNAARHAAKLGRHSVLLRSTSHPRPSQSLSEATAQGAD